MPLGMISSGSEVCERQWMRGQRRFSHSLRTIKHILSARIYSNCCVPSSVNSTGDLVVLVVGACKFCKLKSALWGGGDSAECPTGSGTFRRGDTHTQEVEVLGLGA